MISFFFFQAEDGIRDYKVTGVQTCALPIWGGAPGYPAPRESRKSTGPPRSALRHGAAGSRARGGVGARARARHRGRGGSGRASGRGRGEIFGVARLLKKKKE